MREQIPLDIYDAHLTTQAEISFPKELGFFSSVHEWDAVTSVVDLGCGNGAYLSLLADAFPHISFLGVDFREDSIALAKRTRPRPNVEYRYGWISAIEGCLDALISRFCMLYIDDKQEVVDWTVDHVRNLVLQIDNEDELLCTPHVLNRACANGMSLRWLKVTDAILTRKST